MSKGANAVKLKPSKSKTSAPDPLSTWIEQLKQKSPKSTQDADQATQTSSHKIIPKAKAQEKLSPKKELRGKNEENQSNADKKQKTQKPAKTGEPGSSNHATTTLSTSASSKGTGKKGTSSQKLPRRVKSRLVRMIQAPEPPVPAITRVRRAAPAGKVRASTSKTPPKRRGPLLTKLQKITSATASRFANRLLTNFLQENDILNEKGQKLVNEGEGIFKAAAEKEVEATDKTLSASLFDVYENLESALKGAAAKEANTTLNPLKMDKIANSGIIKARELVMVPVEKPQPPVPGVVCGLERVLFNQGVYQLRDPHSRVYNFDPYLESITPVKEFDYNALKEYITSSRDTTLIETAAAEGRKYTGSTSSMTSALAHFHFLLSKWRPVNLEQLSRGFPDPLTSFTSLQRAPAGIFLRRRNGVYAIDANKEFDTSNVLQWLGKSMEKFLTLDKGDYEKYRKEHSHRLTEDDKNSPESFHYTTFGDFLMRSQLDAYDPRLPGTGMYDLKTRAVVSIRKDASEFEGGLGYEIKTRHGEWESYEREYYDMCRAAFLKYSLQVRMGRMDGIFVAFHNTERIFGFQYLPLSEMDEALHGTTDTTLGDAEFKVSLNLLNMVLDRATERFPEDSLQIQFETRPKNATNGDCFMYIFIRPVEEEDIQGIQQTNLAQMQEYEQRVIGLHGDEQAEVIRAAVQRAAQEAEEEDNEERLEAAFENPDSPESIEVIRNATKKIKKGTPTENAVDKLLDIVAARIENDDAEALADSALVGENSDEGVKASTQGGETGASERSTVENTKGPIMVLKLNIRNTVNGQSVMRPSNLHPTDKWEVPYTLEEITSGVEGLYNASVSRRKNTLNRDPSKKFFDGGYGNEITRTVNKGKEYRKGMDELDEEHGVQVLDGLEFEDFEGLEKRKEEVKQESKEAEEMESLEETKEVVKEEMKEAKEEVKGEAEEESKKDEGVKAEEAEEKPWWLK